MLHVRTANTLDAGDFGWLKTKHHFKVSPEGNPANGPLGALVAWNDDEIAPGTGFGLHGHDNMEIITYVREGAVTHQDSTGNVGITSAGDIQVMSAGTGIKHSERNQGQEPLRMFQIWLLPSRQGVQPRWNTRRFPKADRGNTFTVLASGFHDDFAALHIQANAHVLGATLLAGSEIKYALKDFRYAYLVPARGTVRVNDERIGVGDGIGTTDEAHILIKAEEDAEIVLVVAN
jgi:redox-sensitive bicupin YhaK (pirin superfamily)